MATTESRPATTSHLQQQDLSKLDVTKLTAVSPEVISRQATINVGTIGHVAHGKSTVVKAISGVQTVRFKNELERNITIKLEKLPQEVIEEHISKRKTKKRKREEYIVETILDIDVAEGQPVFLVKWKGWAAKHNTWEPLENLENCSLILRNFLDKQFSKNAEQLDEIKNKLFESDNSLSRESLELLWKSKGYVQCDLDGANAYLLALSTLQDDHDVEERSSLELEVKYKLQEAELHRRRTEQLKQLKEWENCLNKKDSDTKIKIINDVDLEGSPEHFEYVTSYVPAPGIIIPTEPPIGCSCTSCNVRSKCTCALEGGLHAYTSNRRLRVAVGTPIYECNKACKCPPDCTNRLVQRGRTVKLCIFRTSTGCGWGVKTMQRIPQGSFVCQYLGEVISNEEAECRARATPLSAPTYLFDLDFNSADSLYTVDAAKMGNISHFINHSCDPNLGVWAVWGDCLDPNLPMLALFATKEIKADEEITFDYAQNTSPIDDDSEAVKSDTSQVVVNGTPQKIPPESSSIPRSPIKLRLDFINSGAKIQKPECKCGAKNCRKYLF